MLWGEAMTRRKLFQICGIGLGVVVGLFVLLSLNFLLRARANFDQAEAAYASGDVQLAVGYYDQAIRNHSLFSPYGRLARERLLAIAAVYDKDQNTSAALDTYETLLSALSAIETGYSSNRALIEELEATVSRLRSQISQ